MNSSAADDVGASNLLSTALASAAIGTLQLGVAVSLAALIFSGPLSAGAGRASLGFILGTAIVSAVLGLRSSMETVIGGAQDTAAIVAAAVAASIAATTTPSQQVPTVIVMVALASALTGVAMWIVGQYGFGAVVRFLPYPVISGFMAGTGWLLLRGGIEVMQNKPLDLMSFDDVFGWTGLKMLIVGFMLGVFMMICDVRQLGGTIVGVAILVTAIGVHVFGRSMSSLEVLEQDGWLIGPFPPGGGWAPIRPQDLADADWGAIAANSASILAIVVVSIVGVVLNLGGLEDVIDAEIEVDHEVQLSGVANLVSAFGGGLVGYHLLGDTALARQMGVRSRAVPLAVSVIAFVAFAFGYELVALVPRAVAGGVLVGLGLSLLVRWATASLTRMNRQDRFVSTLILAVIATVGILTGVGVGLLVAAAIFIFRYSRIDPVRHTIDAAGRSNVDRRANDRQFLADQRGRIIAVEAQGFLFFGSIARLRRSITESLRSELGADDEHGTRYVIVDFNRVSGIDSTAAGGIRAMTNQLNELSVVPVWSSVDPAIVEEFAANGVEADNLHPDLDHAIAWCEERLLTTAPDVQAFASPPDPYPATITSLLDERVLQAGETLIEVDATDRDLYFVVDGLLTAWTTLTDGRQGRLRQISAGAVIGEVAFITGSRRTATVIADTDAIVRVMTRDRFDQIVTEDPSVAAELQAFLLARLADRLSSTSALARDLMS